MAAAIYRGGRPFIKPGLRINGSPSVAIFSGSGAPTSGTSGTGLSFAGKGSIYIDYTNGVQYVNVGTSSSPQWQASTGSPSAQVETLTAARVLTAKDNNKTFVLGATAGFDVTLPALATSAGFRARFVVGVAPTTAAYSIVSPEGDNIAGQVYTAQDAGGSGDVEADFTADKMNFVNNSSVIGDQADIICVSASLGWAGRMFTSLVASGTFTG